MQHNIATMLETAEFKINDPGAGGRIPGTRGVAFVGLTTSSAAVRTLAAPVKSGQLLGITMISHGGNCVVTVATAYDEVGGTTLTFTENGQSILLVSQEVATGVYAWRVLANDGVEGPTATLSGLKVTGPTTYPPETITYAASIEYDFNGASVQSTTLTGNVAVTTANRAAGKTLLLRFIASGAQRDFTWSETYTWVGGTAPANLASGKTALLSLTCFGSADTDIVAAYAVES